MKGESNNTERLFSSYYEVQNQTGLESVKSLDNISPPFFISKKGNVKAAAHKDIFRQWSFNGLGTPSCFNTMPPCTKAGPFDFLGFFHCQLRTCSAQRVQVQVMLWWRLSVFLHFFCLILVFKKLTSATSSDFGVNWKTYISA